MKGTTPREYPSDALTEELVDHLAATPEGATVMALAIALREPYPRVRAELGALAVLGIVVADRQGSATVWRLG